MNAIRLREIPTYQHMSVCLCQLMDAVFLWGGGGVLGGACTACARKEPVSPVRTTFLM